ncbi:MAG: hypothetical protein ABI577_05380 [bacterium]
MYGIRARAVDDVLEVRFVGQVAPEEALRAVSQAFALADAGNLTRAVCDFREMSRSSGNVIVIGAAFASNFESRHRVAILCDRRQLSLCRRLSRLAGFDERLGVFTREADAEDWLMASPRTQLSRTTLRHFEADAEAPGQAAPRRRSSGAA